MKFILVSDDALRLEAEPGPMTIEAASADQQYSPFHMLASGLAFCTFSILHSWAETVELNGDDLALEIRWTFAEDPHRIDRLDMLLEWPSLPPARRAVAERVAALCPIHATLTHPPMIAVSHGGAPANTAAAHGAAAMGASAADGAAPSNHR